MKVVTWNVNSLKVRRDLVALFLDSPDAPDVLALQELKLEDQAVPLDVFTTRGYEVATYGQKQWNGVLLASRWPLEDVERGLPDGDGGESRLLAATTAGIRIVNVYCPQGQHAESPKFEYKLRFYRALHDWLAARVRPDVPLVVLGDFNVARDPEDVWSPEAMAGVPTYHPLEHAEWDRILALGLADAVKPWVPKGAFSFWDYRELAFPKNRGFRIDHVLATLPVVAGVRGAWIGRDWRKKKGELAASDHAPVGIEIDWEVPS